MFSSNEIIKADQTASPSKPVNSGPKAVDICGNEIGCFWDTLGQYTHTILLGFDHWCVSTSMEQHTLGTCLIFSRHNASNLWELPQEALSELAAIEHFIWEAYQNEPNLKPHNFNFLQLQNAFPHLHLHCVPRYREPRILDGREWLDPNPLVPVEWNVKPVSAEVFHSVHRLLSKAFRNYLSAKSGLAGRLPERPTE